MYILDNSYTVSNKDIDTVEVLKICTRYLNVDTMRVYIFLSLTVSLLISLLLTVLYRLQPFCINFILIRIILIIVKQLNRIHEWGGGVNATVENNKKYLTAVFNGIAKKNGDVPALCVSNKFYLCWEWARGPSVPTRLIFGPFLCSNRRNILTKH